MWFYKPIQTGGGRISIALAAFALLALDTPRAQSGFQGVPLAFDAGSNPLSVAVGDVNGDGIPDLAVAIGGGNNVGVLLGQGGGTFQAAPNQPAGITPDAGISPVAVAVEDFNGDGISDLAVVNVGGQAVFEGAIGQGAVSILLGKGDSTFQAAASYQAGHVCLGLAVADFNGDGFLDLVVANHLLNSGDSFGDVSVILGNGDGTFRAAVDYGGLGSYPDAVAVADFNGDGLPDLAVVNADARSIAILLNDGKWAP